MKRADFRDKFDSVFEHSAWVADTVFENHVEKKSSYPPADVLVNYFVSAFMAACRELQLETLHAHPELACSLDERTYLTPESILEQTGAGLDLCSESEFAEFGRLNTAYSEKFGFPFIIAVRGRSRQKILKIFRMRLQNDAVFEFQTALYQVCRIAKFRIEDILSV